MRRKSDTRGVTPKRLYWNFEQGEQWIGPLGRVMTVVSTVGDNVILKYEDGEGVTLTNAFLIRNGRYLGDAKA